MTDGYITIGLFVSFFVLYHFLYYWFFTRPRSKFDAQDLNGTRMDYAGKYLRKHKPTTNANTILNYAFGAPRAWLRQSAVITQEKIFPDGSFYQGDINFDVMREKTDAVIIRAGQNLWVDSQFKRNWAEARRVGMRRGVYWFWDDRISPGRQAEILIDLIKDDLPEMEVFIDWERKYGGAFGGLSNVVAWMQAVKRALPTVDEGIYTGYYFWIENTNPITNVLQYRYLKDRPLWEAWYTNDFSIIKIPLPWNSDNGITHLQFGTPAWGEDWGVQTQEIDMNYFNGTETEFALRYGGLLPGEPPGNGEPMTTWYEIRTAVKNIRRGPGTNYEDDGDLEQGDKIEVTDKLGDWYKFTRAFRGTKQLLLLHAESAYCSSGYVVVTTSPIVEPPPPELQEPSRMLLEWPNGTTKYYKVTPE